LEVSIEMGDVQPADAPVIFDVRLTNRSDADVHGWFDQDIGYRATLAGPDGQAHVVDISNGSQIEGSFGRTPVLRPGDSTTVPLRLTTFRGQRGKRYLPSEQVFLPAGVYALKVAYRPEDAREPAGGAEGEKAFRVAKDERLAAGRWDGLRKEAAADDRAGDAAARAAFARHVLEATLTPEVRREWYRRLVDPDPKVGRTEMYRLSVLEDPPADVGPAIVEAVKVHARNPTPKARSTTGGSSSSTRWRPFRTPTEVGWVRRAGWKTTRCWRRRTSSWPSRRRRRT
jgi:hypothetical protein